ncbi:hypothetical protein [Sinosporangium siamense]|uniref:Uncharacterized protein n=1 Tax=Sinosporangium siamense TaxID=1367973 RepID=A0A919V7Z4_9ACTN|nr:hypothetical protein [Sinosporangium siamense]GII93933.1 hypothetical protein Ssi02_41640 [Sinosporangium siamense]
MIHALVVTGAGYTLSTLTIPSVAKFAIAGVASLVVCFALAGPIRRIPGVRRVL